MDAISSSSTDNYWDYNESSSSISWTGDASWNSIYSGNDSGSGSRGGGGGGVGKDLIPTATWDVSTFLHQELGPKQLPIDVVVPITVVYVRNPPY